ncbi:PQQ-binding-like beta-propeller repeat protein [Haloterrigena alkaliphila]|uniref:PQQ-like beta-propeller repeat protein n=1 Tax=Haloterrigena alkaliphila TaxID=2816475 RepID=A0A8A2VCJ9_9EURY|nr:PQQ-binding-like beta-propeller repeat protein [Haloterrigena alkaliphila]QSW98132.1 PQQ-binding-like beta-propeller repeat protein [Haloterrigena alkaliphila]
MSEAADVDRGEDGDGRLEFRSVPLGDIETARSRHMWTRSAVHVADGGDLVVTGEWDGTVTARESDSLEARWTTDHPDHAVGITTLEGSGAESSNADSDGDTAETVVVAGRGETGTVAAYDAATGDQRWRYDTVDDLGEAVKDTVFYLPYVVSLETGSDGDTLYAAARRYERDGEVRRWHSTVYAFDADGTVRWRYETDASPIAIDLDADGERLAVGYNRCMGDHDTGLVVLEAETGDLEWTWDPGTEGDRRVGDVSFDGETLAVSSHGDKRGYLLGPGGTERWRVDLAVETEMDGETLYAYPNHVSAADGRVTFVTGNTYAEESRETEGRHPNEHRIATFDADGEVAWDAQVRGFVHGLATGGETIAAPCAQNFRVRDPETHAVRWFERESGPQGLERLEGIATAAAADDGTLAAIEEPVEYHDDGETRGEYALHVAALE